MGTIFMLSLCCDPEHQNLTEESFYMCLVPEFLRLPLGYPLVMWLWRPRGLVLLIPMGL